MENIQKKRGGCWIGCFVMVIILWFVCSSAMTGLAVVVAAMNPLNLLQGGSGTPTTVGVPVIQACLEKKDNKCKSGKYGVALAQAAESIAEHLTGIPDTYYDSGMPRVALTYWNSVCPSTSSCFIDWQQGDLQCVTLVTGAFALISHPLPVAHNAINFWGDYATQPGFQEIPAGSGEMPAVGDIMVFDDSPGVGHVAIIVAVTLPQKGKAGILRFAQANSYYNFATASIEPDGSIQLPYNTDGTPAWPGYTVLGFIRTA